jgi:hypothetical protein
MWLQPRGWPILETRPYADRLFTYRELGRLDPASARAALVGPAAAYGVRIEEDVARQVVDEAAGYPYFLQVYGRELWNYAEASPVTGADLDAVRPIVDDTLATSFFATRFELATHAEQRYLSAMDHLGEGPYPVAAVARALGAPDQRRVSVQREGLMQKGLIWSPRRGRVDFTVPLFDRYLRRHHPL